MRKLNAWALVFLVALPTMGAVASEAVVVSRVLDGDTVEILGRRDHVRLANIDAPETAHNFYGGPAKPGQPFSRASTEFLRRRVENIPGVTMTCVDRDTRYGRDVCELFAGGRSVNQELVEVGLAWANTSAGGRYLHDRSLIEMQAAARRAHLGLWSQDTARSPAVPPWEWRDACWKQRVCDTPGE